MAPLSRYHAFDFSTIPTLHAIALITLVTFFDSLQLGLNVQCCFLSLQLKHFPINLSELNFVLSSNISFDCLCFVIV